MEAEVVLMAIAIVSAVVVVCCSLFTAWRVAQPPSLSPLIEARLISIESGIGRSEAGLRGEFASSREENNADAKSLREEIMRAFTVLADSLRQLLNDLSAAQKSQLELFTGHLNEMKSDADREAKELRDVVQANLKDLGDSAVLRIGEIGAAQKERLENLSQGITTLSRQTAQNQEALRQTVEGRLDSIRTENAAKLEQMRATVDEKLQSTLEQRLGASFKQVSDSLEQVYKSVGEMQALAGSVGDLKKVLTNVKSRGTWGEVTLGNLLEQVMAADQYGRNVEISAGRRVEFAVRLPGDDKAPVWLPIDSKFPMEDYDRLVDAAERGDLPAIESASRAIEGQVRKAARDICERYVHPPHSTDFAVLFLPTEGLFAEVIRRPGLVDALQRECHVMVAGPTTLVSLLTALRMGFRSLAIQKRSGEVWKVLGAVKSEFGKFGEVMDRVSDKLSQAQGVLEEEMGRRRRAMDRQLRAVEALPQSEAVALLGLDDIGLSEPVDPRQAREAAE